MSIIVYNYSSDRIDRIVRIFFFHHFPDESDEGEIAFGERRQREIHLCSADRVVVATPGHLTLFYGHLFIGFVRKPIKIILFIL
jgi:hypothetical protein